MTPLSILNHVVNQPEIRAAVAPGFANLDMERFFDNPDNVMIGDMDGIVLFGGFGEGRYTIHFLFTEETRGPDALREIREAIKIMFTQFHAVAIYGETPRDNRACRAMGRALGFVPIGDGVDAFGRPTKSYVLERALWATSLADSSGASVPSSAAARRNRLI